MVLLLAVTATGSGVPVSTLVQLTRDGVVISSPPHANSFMFRVDVASDGTRPGICQGADFCCQRESDGRHWFLIDSENTGLTHDAWFDELSVAAGFQLAISDPGAGNCRRSRALPKLQSLASWRARSDALIPYIPGFSIGLWQRGRTHHPSNDVMRVIASSVCFVEWRAGALIPFADGSALDFDGSDWNIERSIRGGRSLETVLVLVDQHGALSLLQAADVVQLSSGCSSRPSDEARIVLESPVDGKGLNNINKPWVQPFLLNMF